MLEEDLYLAVPTHSPYGHRTSIRLTDTKDAGYICLAGSRPIRQITNSYFMEAGFTPRICFESDTTESVTQSDSPEWESASGPSIHGDLSPPNGIPRAVPPSGFSL